MGKYLKSNYEFWQYGYNAPNVENVIFRLHGRILKYKYKLPHIKKPTVVLDFGCGQGAIVNYFHQQGYDAYGVDLSITDIEIAKRRYPHIAHKFRLCKSDVFNTPMTKFTDNKKITLITGQQAVYYFDKVHFLKLLKNFRNSLVRKGLIYASMISHQHTYYKFSKKTKYKWLRETTFTGKRFKVRKYFNFYCETKKDVINKFSIFKPIYVGSYHLEIEPDETNNHHFVILCQKKS